MSNTTSTAQAYEWVKTGHWSLRQFREWFDALAKQEQGESKRKWQGQIDNDEFFESLEQEQGEPVAEISRDGVLGVDFIEIERALKLPNGTKLYTTPQQRTWVGLTDEEITDFHIRLTIPKLQIKAIEAKLKEKNT